MWLDTQLLQAGIEIYIFIYLFIYFFALLNPEIELTIFKEVDQLLLLFTMPYPVKHSGNVVFFVFLLPKRKQRYEDQL